MPTINPFARPVYLMAKPAGSLCNLRCKYCYYLEKSKLYDNNEKHIMSDQLLDKFIKDYIEAQTMPEVMFTWHGGETLMRPISFYKKALRLQQQYAGGRRIDYCIQTNATMLTDEWCKFFHDNNFLVGVSIDGPQEFHDAYRKTATGRPTWNQVMRGIRMLNKYNVEWNALAVVNNLNVEHPLEFYHFFKDINCHFIQFTPIVERIVDDRPDGLQLAPGMTEGGQMADFSITAEQWGTFLCTIFEEWVRHDVGEYFIQLFDSALANWVGVTPGLCTMAAECGHAGVMEYNRRVFLRPLRLSRASPRQPSRKHSNADDVLSQATRVCTYEERDASTAMQGVRRSVRMPRRMSQKPIHKRPLRQSGTQLSVCRLSQVLQAHSPIHGVYEGRTGCRTTACQRHELHRKQVAIIE